MLSIYIGGLLFGGVLLGASVVGGHGGDAHVGGGGDTHLEVHGGGNGHGGNHAGNGQPSPLPFLSLRFWAFAIAFFGLTGVALTLTGGLGVLLTPVVAGGVGLGCGYASFRVLRSLTQRPVGLLGGADSHLGREGQVLLPVGPGRRGKIRLRISGTNTDLVAETESDVLLPAGDTVLLVGMRGNVALVERNPAALPGETARRLTAAQPDKDKDNTAK